MKSSVLALKERRLEGKEYWKEWTDVICKSHAKL